MDDLSDLTIAICARNAAGTIGRAIRSAVAQGPCPILLLDDFSDDDTAESAGAAAADAAIAEGALRIVRPEAHGTIATARNAALAHIETPFALWLDADDELLPGRAARLLGHLHAGADLAYDGAELVDGPSGAAQGTVRTPAFVRRPGGAVRMLERNWAPGVGWPAFRTAVVRALGYDPGLRCAEDVDVMQRAIVAGHSVVFDDAPGVRCFTYPGGLSRNLEVCRAAFRAIMARPDDATVHAAYTAAGWPHRVAAWAVISRMVFREDYPAALQSVETLAHATTRTADILEPDGPYPVSEGWRLGFQRATLHLLLGRPPQQAVAELSTCAMELPSPEVLNNLGVAFARIGQADRAAALWRRARNDFPGYVDAGANLGGTERITALPLRTGTWRNAYSAAAGEIR